MIRMRNQGDSWRAVTPRKYGRLLVLVATLLAIALFAWSMRPPAPNGAVVRVSLDRVPEERVVEFGHVDPPLEFVMPVPVEADAEAERTAAEPRDLGLQGPSQSIPGRSERIAAATAPPARTLRPDRNGVLPISFSLTQSVAAENGGVGVAKTLASEQGAATGLTIFLIGGSLIEVDRNELVTALAQLGASDKAAVLPEPGASGRLTLDRVRTAGLDLRYDAVQDRLVLRP